MRRTVGQSVAPPGQQRSPSRRPAACSDLTARTAENPAMRGSTAVVCAKQQPATATLRRLVRVPAAAVRISGGPLLCHERDRQAAAAAGHPNGDRGIAGIGPE